MFNFLRKKLRKGISRISEKLSGKAEPDEPDLTGVRGEHPEPHEPDEKEKQEPQRGPEQLKSGRPPEEGALKSEPEENAEISEEADPKKHIKGSGPVNGQPHPPQHALQEPKEQPAKKGFFKAFAERVTTTAINEKKFNELFRVIEEGLMENNVAVEVIEKIKQELKVDIVDVPIKRGNIEGMIQKSLADAVHDVLSVKSFSLLDKVKSKKPYVICFFGINGSGKTTSIAKIAHLLRENGLSVVFSASDTFRAASIEQIQHHGDILGVRVIKHTYRSDPAAVAFDAVAHAKSKNIDVVLIDTAGRMHSNINLMDELKKVVNVAKPDLKLFVGESITGNDCVEQAKTFNDAVGIDGIILSKTDIDEKGGAALSISYVTQKPILYLGTGQGYTDLAPFRSEAIVQQLGLA